MASGKSVIGRKLASNISLEFIDLDAYIELKEKKTISEIFSTKGEIYFRLKESEYLEELLHSKNSFVLSLGGGTPCYGKNLEIIKSLTTSIYLKASIPTLCKRLVIERNSRPLVATISDEKLPEFVGKHLFERAPFYERAETIISTDTLSINEVVDVILKA